jgi:hypothetical protein
LHLLIANITLCLSFIALAKADFMVLMTTIQKFEIDLILKLPESIDLPQIWQSNNRHASESIIGGANGCINYFLLLLIA